MKLSGTDRGGEGREGGRGRGERRIGKYDM